MSQDHHKFGGGSGGGENTKDESRSFDGIFSVSANQVQFTSRAPLPPAAPDPCSITFLASSIMDMSGNINLRGLAGVRITAGPPPLPEAESSSTQGVEIEVGEIQNVTIKRGLIDGVDQKIEMTPSGITI